MDEHEVMEEVKSKIRDQALFAGNTVVDEVWSTPGSGPSFGLTIEGTRFIITVTELPE